MTSGNLRANGRPEITYTSIVSVSRVLLCSVLLTIGTLWSTQSANAQCDIAPIPGTVIIETVQLDALDTCAEYNFSAILTVLPYSGGNITATGGGCSLWWSDTDDGLGLSQGDVSFCCDGSGTHESGDTIWIYADDDGTLPAVSAGPVGFRVDLLDVTPPEIVNIVADSFPECEEVVTITTDTNWLFIGNSMIEEYDDGNSQSGNCGSWLTVVVPEVTDACNLDSLYLYRNGVYVKAYDPVLEAGNFQAIENNAIPPTSGMMTDTLMWIAVDWAGNADTCTWYLMVVDNEDPIIMCVADDTVSTDEFTCVYNVPDNRYDATFTDNCYADSLTWTGFGDAAGLSGENTLQGVDLPLGVDSIMWIVVDAKGNADTCYTIITVNDSINPIVDCNQFDGGTSPDTTVFLSNDPDGPDDDCMFLVLGDAFDATATDNCALLAFYHDIDGDGLPDPNAPDSSSLDSIRFTKTLYVPGGDNPHSILWIAIDSSGNVDSCRTSISVVDDIAPEIVDCPSPDVTISTELTTCQATYCWEPPDDLQDNCTIVSFGAEAFDEEGNPIVVINVDPPNCTSQSGFDGLFSPDFWTFNIDNGGGLLDETVAPDSLVMYSGPSPDVDCGGGPFADLNVVTLSYTFASDGLFSFNWQLSNTNPWFFFSPLQSLCYYDLNGGTPIDFVDPGLVVGYPNGSDAIPVQQGDVLTFTLQHFNFCGLGQEGTQAIFAMSNMQFQCTDILACADFPVGVNTVRYTLVDCGGNVDTCDFIVNVVDSIPPTANCIDSTVIVELNENGVAQLNEDFIDNNSTDNCGIVHKTLSLDGVNFAETLNLNCGLIGVQDVWLRVADEEGNTDTCMAQIDVQDNIPPVIVCKSINVGLDFAGNASVDQADLLETASDNCGVPTVTPAGPFAFTCADIGLNNVLLTATDGSGNVAQCNATVNVVDVLPPTIMNCPADIYIVLDNDCDTEVDWVEPTATDNCGPATLVSQSHAPGETFQVGTTHVTYLFKDASGNLAECNFDVHISDSEDPLLACTDASKELDLCGKTFITSADVITLLQDDCDIDTILFTVTNDTTGAVAVGLDTVWLNCDFLWTNTVDVYVTDFGGNTATCSSDVFVGDVIAPDVECPDDYMIGTSHLTPGDCYGDTAMVWTFDYDYCLTGPGGIVDYQYYDNDSCNTVIYYSVVNDGGSTVPGGTGSANATDDLSLAGVSFPLGINTVTIWAVDGFGNSDTCYFDLKVYDDEDPVITCVPDVTLYTSEDETPGDYDCYYSIPDNSYDATATDNCSYTIVNDYNGTSTIAGEDLPAGVHVIQWIATDTINNGMGGNMDTCYTTITVIDDENPWIECAADGYRTTSEDGLGLYDCYYTVQGDEFDPVDYGDNCAVDSVWHDFAGAPSHLTLDGALIPAEGVTQVTWWIVDTSGNDTFCIVEIDVHDDEAPFWDTLEYDWSDLAGIQTCGDTLTLPNLDGECNADVEWHRPLAGVDVYDNCTPDSAIEFTEVISNATVQAAINANDPFFSNLVEQNANNMTFDPESNFPVGVTTITYTAEDTVGNVSTCVLTIVVQDLEAPEISCTNPQINLPTICGSFPIPDWSGSIAVIDNCANYSVTQYPPAGTTLAELVALGLLSDTVDMATFEVEFVVSEPNYAGGYNTDTCVSTVTLTDVDGPIPTVPGGSLPEIFAECDTTLDAPTATDICGNTIYIGVLTPNAPLPAGVTDNGNGTYTFVERVQPYDITWVYSDGVNTTEQDQTIFVLPDSRLPHVQYCPADYDVNNDPGLCSAVVDVDTALFWDECDGYDLYPNAVSRSDGKELDEPFAVGETWVVFEYTDIAMIGTAVCSVKVTVTDNEAAVIDECPIAYPAYSWTNDAGLCSSDNDVDRPTFTDNCDGDVEGVMSYRSDGRAETDSFDVGLTQICYNYVDNAGNISASCCFWVEVTDDEDPVVECMDDVTFGTSEDGYDNCQYYYIPEVEEVYDTVSITYDTTVVEIITCDTFMLDSLDITDTTIYILDTLVVVVDPGPPAILDTFVIVDEIIVISDTVVVEYDSISCSSEFIVTIETILDIDTLYNTLYGQWDATATDNCAIQSLNHNYPWGGNHYYGNTLDYSVYYVDPYDGLDDGQTTYDITWLATDIHGNTSTCEHSVTVYDDLDPYFSHCPEDITVYATTNECDQLVSWDAPYAYDNCGVKWATESFSDATINPVHDWGTDVLPYNISYPIGGVQIAQFPVGTTTVTYTIVDAYGNTTVCSFDVHVIDDQAPQVICPSDQTISSICATTQVPDYRGLIDITDNCEGSTNYSIVQSPAPGTALQDVPGLVLIDGESFDVTITVTDPNPNYLSDYCSFTVTIEDGQGPVPSIGFPGGQLPYHADTSCGFVPIVVCAPTAIDAGDCTGGNNIIYGELTPSNIPGVVDLGNNCYSFETGFYFITWVYDDGDGNIVTQQQQINVIDDPVAPTAICQSAVVYLDENGEGSITVADVDGGSYDNCEIDTMTISQSDFDCANVGGASAAMVITAVYDGTLSGGVPKGVELYTLAAIPDLSAYGVESANNGAPDNAPEYVFPAVAVAAGEYIYLTTNNTAFNTYFGFDADFVDGSATNINGDDRVNLYGNGSIIDSYGVEDEDGSGEDWEYTNGWAYRNSDVDANGGAFDVNNWTVMESGFNGCTDNAGCGNPMPIGTYSFASGANIVVLTVTDLNGNVSTCEAEVSVIDAVAPIAQCVSELTVMLDINGEGSITAADVDSNSSDACGIYSLELSQYDFDCGDVGSQYVSLTVTDVNDNTAMCYTHVTVEDNIAPTALCQDVTAELGGYDYACYGSGTVGYTYVHTSDVNNGSWDSCGISYMYFLETGSTYAYYYCADVGVNDLTLVVVDVNGNSSTCATTVTVEDNTDPQIYGCSDVTTCYAEQYLWIGTCDECGIESVDYTVTGAIDTFGTNGDYIKFPVGISTVSWLVTDVNGNTSTCEEVYNIYDSIPPVPVCIDDLNVPLNADGNVTLPAHLFDGGSFDNCSYVTFQMSVNGSDFVDAYTFDCTNVGDNEVTLLVTDQACNTAICVTGVTIQDPLNACPDPVFIVNNASGDIGDTVMVSVTVEDFVDITGLQFSMHVVDGTVGELISVVDGALDVTESITGNDLTVSWFNGATSLADDTEIFSLKVLLVGSVGENTPVTIDGDPLEIEVTRDLNEVNAITYDGVVSITGGSANVYVGGNIAREWGDAVEDVTVDMSGDEVGSTTTDADGDYAFMVPEGSTVNLDPDRDIDYTEFVTISDLIKIQLHIIFLDTLNSPYKLIAADASGNGIISTFDLVQLQALLVGNIDDLPAVDSWVFIDAAFSFTDDTNPWLDQPWPTSIDVLGPVEDDLLNDFVAIKIGDVWNAADPTEGNGAEARGAMIFKLNNSRVQAGDQVSVSFKAADFNQIAGAQMSLSFDNNALAYTDAKFNKVVSNLNENSIKVIEDKGAINFVWFDANGVSLIDGEEFFTLNFTAQSDIADINDLISISDKGLEAFAVNVAGKGMNLGLEFEDVAPIAADEFILYQNRPNPFRTQTIVGFELPSADNATLEVIDQTGRIIRSISADYPKGYSELKLDLTGANVSGVLYYRLSTSDNSAVKTMIIAD